ncbi:MAG: hypothetical protein KJ749_06905, partial [Planctomycetes bacterium]|nr:hypothetical protein [Planctomycetota bacterium]
MLETLACASGSDQAQPPITSYDNGVKTSAQTAVNVAVLRTLSVLAILVAILFPATGWADEQLIIAAMREFLKSDHPEQREKLVHRIASDPAYTREKVSTWLHRAAEFDPLPTGLHHLQVPLAAGGHRTLALRIPAKYDPQQAWPLIYALHGASGRGENILGYVEGVLGPAVEQYIIAAPSDYRDMVVHSDWPPSLEHPAALAALRRYVHLDTDRVFVLGYSRGGHTSWTLGVLYADQFAGAVPLAGTFALPEVEHLWETFLPNMRYVPVLCVWGARDIYADNNQTPSRDGGIAGLNRKLCAAAVELELPVTSHEYPDQGHGGIVPPADLLTNLLSSRRAHYPREITH